MHPPPLRTDLAERLLGTRGDEVDDVSQLLMAHFDPAAGPPEAARSVAHTVAVACLGDGHLWEDLGVAHRGELNALLRHWFPRLVAKNGGDMKWKKFFYRQLCEQAEILICKSPSCAVCSDYRHCFESSPAPAPAGLLPLLPVWSGSALS